MRENGGFVDVVVAMDSIDAVDHRNPETGSKRPLLNLVHHSNPFLR